jgi:hypothetical protein
MARINENDSTNGWHNAHHWKMDDIIHIIEIPWKGNTF